MNTEPTALVPVIDGHNDTLLALHTAAHFGHPRAFLATSQTGHLDLPRAQAGGLAGGFFAVFTPNELSPPDRVDRYPGEDDAEGEALTYDRPLAPALSQSQALPFVMSVLARLYQLLRAGDGAIRLVRSVVELEGCLLEGNLAVILHLEGAEAIDPDLDALEVFYQLGLRSLGPVWSRPNAFGHGVPFRFPATPDVGPGLTPAGRRLVAACNERGILLDLSHLNLKGFWDVAELSRAPLVATHSGAHAQCPSPRNLTDEQLRAIAASGGLAAVNFHTGFLRQDGRGYKPTSLTEIVRHVAYIADLVGVAHVALGSDFDGARMPEDLKDVAGLPRLMAALRRHGFTADEVALIAHGNWLRVLGATWRA